MKLPNFQYAVVPEEKITRYLLDLRSEKGKPKAVFFLSFGFMLENWQMFAHALKQHAVAYEVASIRVSKYGVNYVIEGELRTPDGRSPMVRVVWKVEADGSVPSLVTAYPL